MHKHGDGGGVFGRYKRYPRKMKNGAERRTIGKRDNRTDNKTVEK